MPRRCRIFLRCQVYHPCTLDDWSRCFPVRSRSNTTLCWRPQAVTFSLSFLQPAMASPIISPIEPALISDSVMVLDEVPARKVQAIMNIVFDVAEKSWVDEGHEEGSHVQRWYRSVATGHNAIKGDWNLCSRTTASDNAGVRGRLIAWKTKEPFLPRNLFFRTVDTFRLLPVQLADFRVQIYAHPSGWDHIDNKGKWTRIQWKERILSVMVCSNTVPLFLYIITM
jgi:hypothetical protein